MAAKQKTRPKPGTNLIMNWPLGATGSTPHGQFQDRLLARWPGICELLSGDGLFFLMGVAVMEVTPAQDQDEFCAFFGSWF
jgi:hypothetical protein